MSFLDRHERVQAIPEGFSLHDDDSSRAGYPPGVTHTTRLDVVMRTSGGALMLWTDQCAETFGWSIKPIPSRIPGMKTPDCPVVAYRIHPRRKQA